MDLQGNYKGLGMSHKIHYKFARKLQSTMINTLFSQIPHKFVREYLSLKFLWVLRGKYFFLQFYYRSFTILRAWFFFAIFITNKQYSFSFRWNSRVGDRLNICVFLSIFSIFPESLLWFYWYLFYILSAICILFYILDFWCWRWFFSINK